MAELPAGTVTFLFTDIQGSTRLLQQLGADRYGQVLSDHRLILRTAIEEFNGSEIDTQGDSFFVSFPRASEAVAAVVQIQRALAGHEWPEGVAVRVRMGLHTGEPLVAEEGYVGMDVHRAARIAHVGHGGQVLLSETTTSLVTGELPAEFPLLTSLELVVPPGLVGVEEEPRVSREVGESPNRGLAAFREDDTAFFFGRETFTSQLLEMIRTDNWWR